MKMNTRIAATVGVVLALALQAKPSNAQVTITYGSSSNYPSQTQNYSYPTYSVPSTRVYQSAPSYGYQVVTPYQQVTPQYRVESGRYRSGYRGYAPSYTPNPTYQGGISYGNHVYGNGYYQPNNNGYYQPYGNAGQYFGTPSQQRGAVIGGAIGNAVGGQRSGNVGAAIGAAIGRP